MLNISRQNAQPPSITHNNHHHRHQQVTIQHQYHHGIHHPLLSPVTHHRQTHQRHQHQRRRRRRLLSRDTKGLHLLALTMWHDSKHQKIGRRQWIVVLLVSYFSGLCVVHRAVALVHPSQSALSSRWVPSSHLVLQKGRPFPNSSSQHGTESFVRSKILLTTTNTDGSDNIKVRFFQNDNY